MSVPIYGWNMCNCFSCKVHLSFLHFCWDTWAGVKASDVKLWPGICVKYFLSFPQKNLSPEKSKSKCQMVFIGINVNFIIQIQKLKSKPLVCLSFLRWQVFWGNERKYFTHIPGLSQLSHTVFDYWVTLFKSTIIVVGLFLKALQLGMKTIYGSSIKILNWNQHE